MAKILSGCPILESLTLYFCHELKVLDISISLRLRTLTVDRETWVPGPTHIVAPHIHSLTLITSQLSCSLVDVASLNEAKIDICFLSIDDLEAEFLQVMVQNMLEKLQNIEKLTFGGDFIQILSLAEIRGVPFPIFKVKALTLETQILQYVIPGMERLLQNSPDLEKLTIRASDRNTLPGKHLNQYLASQGLNSDQCWRPKHGVSWDSSGWRLTLDHVASLVEIVLKNTNKLDKMVVVLYEHYLTFNIKEVVPTLSLINTNVTIVFSSTNTPRTSDDLYDW